jgi:hypothetical protein
MGTSQPSPNSSTCLSIYLLASVGKVSMRAVQGGAVGERSGVQVHQLGDKLGNPIRNACNHKASVAVPKKYDVVEILEFDEVHHVGDVGVQVDPGRGEVHPLA